MEINPGPSASRIDIKNMTLESRKALCEEWKASGLKASVFCKQKGLCRSTFHGWCTKLGLHPNKTNDSNKRKYQKRNDKNWLPLISKNEPFCESQGFKSVEMKFSNQIIMRLSLSMDDIQLLLKGLCDATTVIR